MNINEFFDNSEEARQKRKDERTQIRALAEKAWEDMNNEGDNNEKSYWIHGFCLGYSSKKEEDESKA